jgi:hypothetical protein
MPAPNFLSFGTLSMDVSSGLTRTVVTVSNDGTGFFGTVTVDVNGTVATSVTVLAHNNLTFRVPIGATTGTVTVTNPDGETASAGTFTVTGEGKLSASGRRAMSLSLAVGV